MLNWAVSVAPTVDFGMSTVNVGKVVLTDLWRADEAGEQLIWTKAKSLASTEAVKVLSGWQWDQYRLDTELTAYISATVHIED